MVARSLAALLVAGLTCAQEQRIVRLEPVATLTVDGGVTHAAAFSHDGKALAMGGERGDLFVHRVD